MKNGRVGSGRAAELSEACTRALAGMRHVPPPAIPRGDNLLSGLPIARLSGALISWCQRYFALGKRQPCAYGPTARSANSHLRRTRPAACGTA